ncbi:MAG: hypothetical protein JNJ61_24920 [Anaerolineae bacterium]|nr:hypothetical protein [Anaerolineae bacterium]
MPVIVVWDDEEQTIQRYSFVAPWTWDEYRAAVEQAWTDARTRPYVVNVIIDFTHMGALPQGYLTHFSRTAMTRISPNLGIVVLVGMKGFMHTVNQLMMQLFPRLAERINHANSLEEARAIIARHVDERKLKP